MRSPLCFCTPSRPTFLRCCSGHIFGTVVYDTPASITSGVSSVVNLSEIHVDIMDYIQPAVCSDAAFRCVRLRCVVAGSRCGLSFVMVHHLLSPYPHPTAPPSPLLCAQLHVGRL